MMVKELKWAAVLLLIMGTLSCVPAAAAQTPVITGDTVSTTAGKVIYYQVRLTGNPGLSSFKIQLKYDTDVLSAVTLTDGKEIQCEQGSVTTDRAGLVSAVCEDGCQVFWYDTREVDADGTLFSVPLKVAEDAPLGTYSVTVSYDRANTTNSEGERIQLECAAGSVTVRKWEPAIVCTAPKQVKLGDTFTCSVALQDNSGIASCNFQLVFDSDQFELVKDGQEQLLWNRMGAFQTGTVTIRQYPNAVNALWYHTANSYESGSVLCFTLRVKKATPPGKASIALICQNPGNNVDEDEKPVPLTCYGCEMELQSKASVELTRETNSATVRVQDADFATKAIMAFYASDGRMLRVMLMPLENGTANASVTFSAGEVPSLCKTVLLNQSWVPLDSWQSELD